MKNIEEQLKNLPKAKMPLTADLKIRIMIYRLQWRKYAEKQNIFRLFSRKMAYAFASVLLLASTVSVPAFAYASPGVVKGNPFYPLKILLEKAELAIPKSNEAEAKIYEKNVSRRLAEAEILSKQTGGKTADYLVETVNQAQTDKEKASAIISGLGETKDAGLLKKIDQTEKQQEALIKQVAQNVGLEASDKVVNSVSLMISTISDKANKADKRLDSEETSPKGNVGDSKGMRNVEQRRTEATSSESMPIPDTRDEAIATQTPKSPIDLGAEKKKLDEMAKTIKQDDFPGKGADTLRAKLETRNKKTSQALDEGNLGKAEELIKESHRLMDNAKFFLKSDPAEPGGKNKKPGVSVQPNEKPKDPVERSKGTSTKETLNNKEKPKSKGHRNNN